MKNMLYRPHLVWDGGRKKKFCVFKNKGMLQTIPSVSIVKG
jgi:hypothetical protein